jgi:hypothetical protein
MEHNRSVLKERRIHPGALDCFAVAECRGWRWGSVPRRRSAGPVLHSQVGSGEEVLSRFARGVWVIASNARSGPVPLPLGVGVMLGGWWF